MKDTRGRKSWTLFFVFVSWVAVLLKFILSGVSLGSLGIMPTISALEFGGAITAILAPWIAREYTEKITGVPK
jgi:hypothetical protein